MTGNDVEGQITQLLEIPVKVDLGTDSDTPAFGEVELAESEHSYYETEEK